MKKQLLNFAIVMIFLKLLFIPQFASAQNSRVWGTYYGDLWATQNQIADATDAAGNVYLAGYIYYNGGDGSIENLGWKGFQDTIGTSQQGSFLAKFDANGNRLWATYYWNGQATSVATDATGNVYLAGGNAYYGPFMGGVNWNLSSGGFQDTMQAQCGGAFLVKFDANGNRLWATYYGGGGDPLNNQTIGNSVATDAAGNVYMGGCTTSTSGIASGGFQNTFGPGGYDDAFLVKFDANGNRLWATYYGGQEVNDVTIGYGVSTDAGGNVFMTGYTTDSTGIAANGFQNTFVPTTTLQTAAFLVKFDANGNRLWGTYYGGTIGSVGKGVAADASGNVYLAGNTADPTGIASGGFQDTLFDSENAFLVKFDANGNRLWGTYFGNVATTGYGVATGPKGDVWLSGIIVGSFAAPSNIFYSGGFQDTVNMRDDTLGWTCQFVVKFDDMGNRQCGTLYSGYWHGCGSQTCTNAPIALDTSGGNEYLYLAGAAGDTSGLATPNCFQDTIRSFSWRIKDHAGNAFLAKFTSCAELRPVAGFQSSDSTFCSNQCINYTDRSAGATSWQWSFPGATPSSSSIQNPQGICYDSAGTFNAKLIVSNSAGSDTLTFINYVKVFVAPPTPVITQHGDTLFCSTDPSYTSYQWYDNTTLIPGATDTFLVITHSGNYNVAVHNESGCFISVGINIVAGIQNYTVSNLFSLSPNPASTQLTIHYSSSVISGNAVISIINVLSQTVLSNSLPFGEGRGGADRGEVLDISNLSAGMYFLQLKTESSIDAKRFIKE